MVQGASIWSRPPGRVSQGLTLAFLLLAGWARSVPGGYFAASIAALCLALPLGATWLARACAFAWTRAGHDGAHWTRTEALALLAFPAVVLVLWFHVPLRVRFVLSLPALRAEVQRVCAARESEPNPEPQLGDARRIGLFSIERVDTVSGGVRFLVADSGYLDRYGLVWSPDGEPAQVRFGDFYRPFVGDWWLWRWNW